MKTDERIFLVQNVLGGGGLA